MTSTIKVPYERGNLLSYAGYLYGHEIEWRDNEPFAAVLRVDSIERGRSAAKFILRDKDNHRFPMFMRDMLDLLKTASIVDGAIAAVWVVRKRGSNYGIALAA